jgi:hypothetical protein
MFSKCELSHINEESEEEGIWLEGVKHKSVEIIRTGDILLLPNGDPGRNKMVNLEFVDDQQWWEGWISSSRDVDWVIPRTLDPGGSVYSVVDKAKSNPQGGPLYFIRSWRTSSSTTHAVLWCVAHKISGRQVYRLVKFKVGWQVGQDDAVTFPEASDSSVSTWALGIYQGLNVVEESLNYFHHLMYVEIKALQLRK